MATVVTKSKLRLGQQKDAEKAPRMSDGASAISRRPARIFTDNQDAMDMGQHTLCKSRTHSPDERDQATGDYKLPTYILPAVNIGVDILEIFANTQEEMGKQVIKSLQQAAHLSDTDKEDGRPHNFGVVSTGKIYRSSMPIPQDFQYLKNLGLKTILSLVQKDFDPEFLDFMQRNSINHIVVDMPGTKKVAIPEIMMASIMKIILNKDNYPMLIHCNHGKHRTGCAIAVLRHVISWPVESILDEYRGFAEPKVRECDVGYISNYKVSSLQGLFAEKRVEQPKVTALRSQKMARMLITTIIVLIIWITTLSCW